jgi:hypothetical protein
VKLLWHAGAVVLPPRPPPIPGIGLGPHPSGKPDFVCSRCWCCAAASPPPIVGMAVSIAVGVAVGAARAAWEHGYGGKAAFASASNPWYPLRTEHLTGRFQVPSQAKHTNTHTHTHTHNETHLPTQWSRSAASGVLRGVPRKGPHPEHGEARCHHLVAR